VTLSWSAPGRLVERPLLPGRNTLASCSPALSKSRTTGRSVGRPAGFVGSDVGVPASGSGVLTAAGSADTSSASTVSASPAAGSTTSFGVGSISVAPSFHVPCSVRIRL
jgi:hypothetical protein